MAVRIYRTKAFTKYCRDEDILPSTLRDAVEEIGKGLHDGDLGSRILKKRVARPGAGKRGGYRTIIAYQSGERAVFLHGFAKNEKENISQEELKDLKKLAKTILACTDNEMQKLVDGHGWTEITR